MAKRDQDVMDSVGWRFWLIVFVVLLIPCLYLAWNVVDDDEAFPIPIGMGTILSGFLAAVVAWVVNMILQSRARRLHEATRKKAKKR